MSSVAPPAAIRCGADPEPLEPVGADDAVRRVGVQEHLAGRASAPCRTPPGRPALPVREPVLADHDEVGTVAGREQRVGTGVDPDQHRPLLADEPAQPAQVGLVVEVADDDDDRSARPSRCAARGTPWPCSSRSCSRRRNSVVLWVKLCSWVASPLAGLVHQRRDVVERRARGRWPPAGRRRKRRRRDPAGRAVAEPAEHLRRRRRRRARTPAPASSSGPRLG